MFVWSVSHKLLQLIVSWLVSDAGDSTVTSVRVTNTDVDVIDCTTASLRIHLTRTTRTMSPWNHTECRACKFRYVTPTFRNDRPLGLDFSPIPFPFSSISCPPSLSVPFLSPHPVPPFPVTPLFLSPPLLSLHSPSFDPIPLSLKSS